MAFIACMQVPISKFNAFEWTVDWDTLTITGGGGSFTYGRVDTGILLYIKEYFPL